MGIFLRRGPAPHRMKISDLEIGRSIKLNLNGTPGEWLVVHQGLPSSIYDTSCDGTWLLMKDIYTEHAWSNSQDYMNNTFLGLFDSNIKDAIKQVKIPYYKTGGMSDLSCKVFLLSSYEVGWRSIDNPYFPQDGAKLSYFESGDGASASNKRIAKWNGSAASWWLRSPNTGSTNLVYCVFFDGSYRQYNTSISCGIRPAIILPSDMLVTDDMLAA